jgi:hypothetical protein
MVRLGDRRRRGWTDSGRGRRRWTGGGAARSVLGDSCEDGGCDVLQSGKKLHVGVVFSLLFNYGVYIYIVYYCTFFMVHYFVYLCENLFDFDSKQGTTARASQPVVQSLLLPPLIKLI